ncbi:MAG: hypothetical protein N3D84_00490 [Candidatus Woesearchaeota archaeon]|nr:hypothetical protein [Candidatus Woesearchaeota archaeon]
MKIKNGNKRKLKKRKKAEVPSSVFIYALTAVIIALILIFGYKSISKLISTTSQTETAQFITDIKNIILEYTSYGKNNIVKMKLPSTYNHLCFVATENPDNFDDSTDIGYSDYQNILKIYPAARDVAESAENVFIGKKGGEIIPFKVNNFRIENDLKMICFQADSAAVIKFRIQGEGDKALISKVD